MWTETIKPLLSSILTSKKALALLAGAIVWALAQAGVVANPEAILPLLAIVASYIFGQGLADIGKESTKLAVDAVEKPSASKTVKLKK